MPAIEVLGAWASKFLAPLIGTSPDFDRTCRVLAIGRRRCLITATIVNLASTMAPPGSLSSQDAGAMGASALFTFGLDDLSAARPRVAQDLRIQGPR